MVEVLLQNDAQVDLQDCDGHSSLMGASRSGHVDVVKVLLENDTQVNLQGSHGESSLMAAS